MNVASRPRQRGNTVIGIIIGLVVGLGIAVVVALAITKGTMPFTDKQGKGGKAAEPSGNQVLDPNKPMYGKDGAKEAREAAARDAKPAAPATTAPPPADPLQQVIAGFKQEPVREAKPEAKPEIKPEIKPAPAEKAKPATPAAAPAVAGTAPAPAKGDGADEKFIYYLQAGAFREKSDAESARAKLALLGFESSLSERSTDSGVLHRVRMGPYNQVETMNRVRGKLSENGVDVAVIRNQK